MHKVGRKNILPPVYSVAKNFLMQKRL
jgi:hypothetical protein